MKKIYQKPEIEMVLTAQTLLNNTSSPDITPGDGDVEAGDLDVKRGGRGTHDVWDDDWSK